MFVEKSISTGNGIEPLRLGQKQNTSMSPKRLCVVLSMHQLLMVMAIAREKNLPLHQFDCFILRSGADYESTIKELFPNAKTHTISRFRKAGILDRAREIKNAALEAIQSLDLSKFEIEIWIPNKTYHIINFIYANCTIKRTIGFEDGSGAYIDSGFLEWKSGLRVSAKKLISIALFFPAYQSLYGVARFNADEYWALSSSALFPAKPKVVTQDNYRLAAEDVLAKTSDEPLPSAELFGPGPYLIIAGQPLAEVGLCSPSQSVKFFEEIALSLTSTDIKPRSVIYLPHPTESDVLAKKRLESFVSKLNQENISYRVYPNKVSIEIFIKALSRESNQISIISPLSTSLYSCKISTPSIQSYYFTLPFLQNQKVLQEAFQNFGVQKI